MVLWLLPFIPYLPISLLLSKTPSWRVSLQKIFNTVLIYSEVLGWKERVELFLPLSIPYLTLCPDFNKLMHYGRKFWLLLTQSIINIPYINQRHSWGFLDQPGLVTGIRTPAQPTGSVGGHVNQSQLWLTLAKTFGDDLLQEKFTLDSMNAYKSFFSMITTIKPQENEKGGRRGKERASARWAPTVSEIGLTLTR